MDGMKVGVVTDDGKTVSPHFGMAQYYLVYEIENGVIKKQGVEAQNFTPTR